MASQAGIPLEERRGAEEKSFCTILHVLHEHPGTTLSEFRMVVYCRICTAVVMISLAKHSFKKYSCCQIMSVMIKYMWKITYSHLTCLCITGCQFLYSIFSSLWNTGCRFSSQENINNTEKKNLISYNKNTVFVPDIEVFHTADQQSFTAMGGNKDFVIVN